VEIVEYYYSQLNPMAVEAIAAYRARQDGQAGGFDGCYA
jgi:hypothetical protein